MIFAFYGFIVSNEQLLEYANKFIIKSSNSNSNTKNKSDNTLSSKNFNIDILNNAFNKIDITVFELPELNSFVITTNYIKFNNILTAIDYKLFEPDAEDFIKMACIAKGINHEYTKLTEPELKLYREIQELIPRYDNNNGFYILQA